MQQCLGCRPCAAPAALFLLQAESGNRGLPVAWLQVPGSSGTLVVMVMPRYVLRNCLAQSVQFRQQETLLEKELAPGASRPLRWTDAALPRCNQAHHGHDMTPLGFSNEAQSTL